MALTLALNGTAVHTSTDASSYNYSADLTAGKVYFLCVNVTGATAPTITPTATGETFTPIENELWGTSNIRRAACWWFVASSTGAKTIAIACGVTAQSIHAVLVEATDVDTTTPVVQSETAIHASDTGAVGVTLPSGAASADNRTLFFYVNRQGSGATITPEADHTVLTSASVASPTSTCQVSYNPDAFEQDPTTTVSSFNNSIATAIEVAAAPTGVTEAIGRAVEVDAARAVGRSKARVLARAVETGAARVLARAKARVVGRAAEVDAARALTASKAQAIGRAAEVDDARPLTASKARAIDRATETDAARTFGTSKLLTLGRATETDAARSITPNLAGTTSAEIGRALEADDARAFTASKLRTIGRATEVDDARAFTASKARTIGRATELGDARTITPNLAGTTSTATGRALEVDDARAFTVSKVRAIGRSVEADDARAITWARAVELGRALEVDDARSLTVARSVTLGPATELEVARTLAAGKALTIGQAAESDAARAITRLGGLSPLLRDLTASAGPLRRSASARALVKQSSTSDVSRFVGATPITT